MPELQRLSADHASGVLAFELANRSYFAGFISDRGDEYFEHFADRQADELVEQDTGECAYYVLVADDGSIIGRFNLRASTTARPPRPSGRPTGRRSWRRDGDRRPAVPGRGDNLRPAQDPGGHVGRERRLLALPGHLDDRAIDRLHDLFTDDVVHDQTPLGGPALNGVEEIGASARSSATGTPLPCRSGVSRSSPDGSACRIRCQEAGRRLVNPSYPHVLEGGTP